jgi:hypothetical protein
MNQGINKIFNIIVVLIHEISALLPVKKPAIKVTIDKGIKTMKYNNKATLINMDDKSSLICMLKVINTAKSNIGNCNTYMSIAWIICNFFVVFISFPP